MSAVHARHILIIDDADQTVAQLREVLGAAGYRVTIRRSVVSHDEVTAIAPDLIVFDPVVGDAAGPELLRRLRADPRTAGLPIIVCSSDAEAVRRLDGDVIGPGVGLVMQPIDGAELLAEIALAWRRVAELEPVVLREERHEAPVLA